MRVDSVFCVACCEGVTQQFIDEMRLTSENVMLNDIQTLVANGGDIATWLGCYGETLASARSFEFGWTF